MQDTKVIKACRVCKSEDLKPIYSFGDLYLSAFKEAPNTGGWKAPLALIECQECTLLQLTHTAPFNKLYKEHYWYKSGINPVIVKDLEEIAKLAEANAEKGDIILDIGANDGTLLSFIDKKYRRVGVEPADNLQKELAENCDIAIHGEWDKVVYGEAVHEPAQVITAIGMFYDTDDPVKFLLDVRDSLNDDGVFIAQLMTLAPMLRKNDLGNICHEHLLYYSYNSLKELFTRAGLEIFHLEENEINGGSYRIFARVHQELAGLPRQPYEYDEPKPDYERFFDTMKDNLAETFSFIHGEVMKGKNVYGYGASTKGNTLLQVMGLNASLITGIADRNPEKWGKYTVGTDIPIVSEEEARKKADYFFVLPYAFIDSFIEREKEWMKKGGKFIVSTPSFKIYE